MHFAIERFRMSAIAADCVERLVLVVKEMLEGTMWLSGICVDDVREMET